MTDETLASLQQLGLSLYEARLYIGLLTHGPQNGNELSRSSGVPSSKTYAMLDRMVANGIVHHTGRGAGAEYVCVPPSELLELLRSKYNRPLEQLERVLPTLQGEQSPRDLVQIANARAIRERARAIIRAATSEVFLSAWDENIDDLRAELASAEARGVRVFAMIYGDTELGIGTWLRHSYRGTVASRIGGHMLTLVADGVESLIAHIPENGEPTAVQTRNPVICLVIEEYLRHDLVLQKAKTMTGFEEWDAWLHANEDVQDLTLGRTGQESPIDPDVPAAGVARARR